MRIPRLANGAAKEEGTREGSVSRTSFGVLAGFLAAFSLLLVSNLRMSGWLWGLPTPNSVTGEEETLGSHHLKVGKVPYGDSRRTFKGPSLAGLAIL